MINLSVARPCRLEVSSVCTALNQFIHSSRAFSGSRKELLPDYRGQRHSSKSLQAVSDPESIPPMANGQKMGASNKIAQDMLDFINASVTQFHAVGKSRGFLQF